MPRLENDIVVAFVWPRPPDLPGFKSLPHFSLVNAAVEPLAAGASVAMYHSAANFNRFTGSIACDQIVRVSCDFSNDEVAPDGGYVSDKNIASLNWDAVGLDKEYRPADRGGIWFMRTGKWLRVKLTNLGDAEVQVVRLYVRGSTI